MPRIRATLETSPSLTPKTAASSVSALDVAVVVDHLEAVMLIRGAVHDLILP